MSAVFDYLSWNGSYEVKKFHHNFFYSVSYYGDPGTLLTPLCVTNCLIAGYYKDIANKRTCEPSCSYSSSYKGYKDPTKMMCVARCPSYPLELYAQGNSSATAICGSSCPAGQSMLDSNMSCVTACPILLDPTTNKCVTLCSFSSALNTVLYADMINKICVTSTNCPANTYASDDSLTCVSTCPNGTYISGKNCVVICPDGTYINPNTQSCVAAPSCPSNYYGNNQTGTCEANCTGGTFVKYSALYLHLPLPFPISSVPISYLSESTTSISFYFFCKQKFATSNGIVHPY